LETTYPSQNNRDQAAYEIGKEIVKKEIGIGCLNGDDLN
jgi:hypothetical protein